MSRRFRRSILSDADGTSTNRASPCVIAPASPIAVFVALASAAGPASVASLAVADVLAGGAAISLPAAAFAVRPGAPVVVGAAARPRADAAAGARFVPGAPLSVYLAVVPDAAVPPVAALPADFGRVDAADPVVAAALVAPPVVAAAAPSPAAGPVDLAGRGRCSLPGGAPLAAVSVAPAGSPAGCGGFLVRSLPT